MVDITKYKNCPECGSYNIVKSQLREQIICTDCGLVFEPYVPIAPKAKMERPVLKAREVVQVPQPIAERELPKEKVRRAGKHAVKAAKKSKSKKVKRAVKKVKRVVKKKSVKKKQAKKSRRAPKRRR